MGASGWAYFVPYEPDINAALQHLRERVFAAGKYHYEQIVRLESKEFEGLSGANLNARITQWARAQPRPQTIEELLRHNGDSGTHSILDIDTVSDTADPGSAAPLPTAQLIELLGTDRPTHDAVEAHAMQLQLLRRRWEASYVIVYRDGAPHEIYFTGYSGD